MLPPVIHEQLIQRFNYWNQTIKQGMVYRNQLYDCCRVYPQAQRAAAYALVNEWAERGLEMCLTVSAKEYIVWINLRSVPLLNQSDHSAPSDDTAPSFHDYACV